MFMSLSMRASAFTTSSLTMASSSKYSKGATRRRACATPRARLDAGVGAFGSKAGMTQVFTEDGLCVPVTVIAVREGNVVTQVRIRGNFFVCVRACARSRRCRSTRRRIHSFIHSFIHSRRASLSSLSSLSIQTNPLRTRTHGGRMDDRAHETLSTMRTTRTDDA